MSIRVYHVRALCLLLVVCVVASNSRAADHTKVQGKSLWERRALWLNARKPGIPLAIVPFQQDKAGYCKNHPVWNPQAGLQLATINKCMQTLHPNSTQQRYFEQYKKLPETPLSPKERWTRGVVEAWASYRFGEGE